MLPALTGKTTQLTPVPALRHPSLIYYRRFPGDYLRDTIHLSAAEDGMYGRLLDKFYSSEKPLPIDRKILYAMVRANTKEDQRAVESVLKQFFSKCSRGYTNNRARREVERSCKISIERSKAAKQRGKVSANAQQMLSKLVTPDSRLQTTTTRPPLPPASGGNGNGNSPQTHDEMLKDEHNYSYLPWAQGCIIIRTGKHRRVFTKSEIQSMTGCSIERALERIHAKGFWAEIYQPSGKVD
jgi:uncharacterized protein YdaU (DUF1376 family)